MRTLDKDITPTINQISKINDKSLKHKEIVKWFRRDIRGLIQLLCLLRSFQKNAGYQQQKKVAKKADRVPKRSNIYNWFSV